MLEVQARGLRFNALRMGEAGPVVVMIHGLLIDNHASFYMTLAPALRGRARVVLYDLRGHGRSEQPPAGYTAEDMAADLDGILDTLGLGTESLVLVGHSFGGHIALRYATLNPGRLTGLVLLESFSGGAELGSQMAETLALEGEARKTKMRELFGHWLAKHAARGHVDPGQLDLASLDADRRATVEKMQRLGRRRRSPMVESARALRDRTTFVEDLSAVRPLPDAALARIACPALAVYGGDSDLLAEGRHLASVLPRCTLRVLPGHGHGILFHATAAVREAITAWMDEAGL
jgi:pimeloyl-ACP methyl ester carboxylesterase